MNNSGLTIFTASAGSGKTYQLVGEYLKMLFARPYSYRNILAVTFTNKATAEMKARILKELETLSSGKDSNYLSALLVYGSEQDIRKKAKQVLTFILHDFSRFSVMTIDSFFQKVIRSFAREIKLNASFKTEIDNRQAVEDAIDLLFMEIDQNELLMNWMIRFVEENLEEGKSWDFKKELIQFANEVDKEAFKIHGNDLLESLSGTESLSDYIGKMNQVIHDSEALLIGLGQKGLDLMGEHGISYDQLKGARGSFANHFNKLVKGNFEPPTKTTLDACNNLEVWSKKTDSMALKSTIESLYINGLNKLLCESIETLSAEIRKINTARAILKNIFPFGLLGNIAAKMKEVLAENNAVLLSDSAQLIGKIIEGNDTPFIYERVGTIYRHFMLDEFQDTSRQQWNNFRPLVENALASGFNSLIVGDVKQSIYRWRNGDWSLLAHKVASDLSHMEIHSEPLRTNYRSRQNIIKFNNTIFKSSSAFLNSKFKEDSGDTKFPELQDVITQAYQNQDQIIFAKEEPQGYVRITFSEYEGASNKGAFREQALQILMTQLEEVQNAGVPPDEITILVRENSEAALVAKALWERKKTNPQPGCYYDAITSDTLKVSQSPVVKFIVNFFRYFTGKDKLIARAEILYGYQRILQPLITDQPFVGTDLHTLFDPSQELPELFRNWLEDASDSEFINDLLSLPLYELAVAVTAHFRLGSLTGEKVYLQAFLDMILEYSRDASGGITGFLDWWEDAGFKKTLNLPNLKNFIRISSIHQSKGLEYHSVFIPFCNWELALSQHKAPFLWCIPEVEPFNQLKMVLLKCDKMLQNSIFDREYYQEMMFSMMDNLNLLYVALTRSVQNLFLVVPFKQGNSKMSSVADLLQQLVEQPEMMDSIDQEKFLNLGDYWDAENKILEIGRLTPMTKKKESDPIKSTEPLNLYANRNKLDIRLHSKDYFLLNSDEKSERINRGNLMHLLFEKIATKDDIESAVDQLVFSGQLTSEEGEDFKSKIQSLLAKEPFSTWFADHWKVINERDILRNEERKHRPDRVIIKDDLAIVIDYKTGEKTDKDLRQMKGYMTDLKRMGYQCKEGNIWYLNLDEIVKVEME